MSFGYFVQRYLSEQRNSSAEKLVEAIKLLGLYKVDQAPEAICRRSAIVPAFSDDTHPDNELIIECRIKKDVNKSFSMYDMEQFYAIQLMGSRWQEDTPNDIYLRMAFFMFVADKVSLHPNPEGLSLLAALRKVGFMAIPRSKKNLTREELLCKFKEALALLCLPELNRAADSWYEGNYFDVAGHRHGIDSVWFLGHYTELARYLCMGNPYFMQVQDCVDYAYGNKELITVSYFKNGFLTEDAALLNHTINMFFDKTHRDAIIKSGEQRRISDLKTIMGVRIPVMPDDEYRDLVKLRAERLDNLKKYLPPEIMQIAINKGIILSESTKTGIGNIYPIYTDDPGRLPGLTEEECHNAKDESRSLSLTSYDLTMVSPGIPRLANWPPTEGISFEKQEKLPPFTEDEVLQHNANSFTHEMFHQITNWVINVGLTLPGDQKTMYNKMIWLVNELSFKLNNGTYDHYKNHPAMKFVPQSMEGIAAWPVDILQVINPTSYLYGNYYPVKQSDSKSMITLKSDKRAEEVCANIFALIYTEMRRNNDVGIENNAFYSGEIQIPELKELVDLLHKFMQHGLRLSQPEQLVSMNR